MEGIRLIRVKKGVFEGRQATTPASGESVSFESCVSPNGSEVGARLLKFQVVGSNPRSVKNFCGLVSGIPSENQPTECPPHSDRSPGTAGQRWVSREMESRVAAGDPIDPEMGRQGSASIGKGLATLGRRALAVRIADVARQ